AGVSLSDDERWQEWPPEASPQGGPGPSQFLKAPAPGDRKPGPSSTGNELPDPLSRPAPEALVNGAKPGGRAAKRMALVFGALLALGVAGWYGQYWWTTGRYLVSTDDAYVGAKNATLAAKITGYVADVLVDDNAHVHEGDIIARIDDGDYQLAVK